MRDHFTPVVMVLGLTITFVFNNCGRESVAANFHLLARPAIPAKKDVSDFTSALGGTGIQATRNPASECSGSCCERQADGAETKVHAE
jgi:hypothetical protein